MIKDTEYESLGENIFPTEYLSEEEKKELGIVERKCCKNKGGCSTEKSCTKGCNSLSNNKGKSKCGTCTNCGCSK